MPGNEDRPRRAGRGARRYDETPMIKLCLFDCDGTLVDSQHAIVGSMAAAFAAHGQHEPAAAAVRRVVGLSLAEAVSALLPEADDRLCRRVADSYRVAFAELRRRGSLSELLYPGAVDSLDAIERAGWLLGMATGKSARGARETLARLGLGDRFVTVQTADVSAGKPSPEMMLRAMAETGAEPHTTVMVGDTTYDMLMARNAGSLALGVGWGYHHLDELTEAGAHAVVSTFAEVLPAAEGLLADAVPEGDRPSPPAVRPRGG